MKENKKQKTDADNSLLLLINCYVTCMWAGFLFRLLSFCFADMFPKLTKPIPNTIRNMLFCFYIKSVAWFIVVGFFCVCVCVENVTLCTVLFCVSGHCLTDTRWENLHVYLRWTKTVVMWSSWQFMSYRKYFNAFLFERFKSFHIILFLVFREKLSPPVIVVLRYIQKKVLIVVMTE